MLQNKAFFRDNL